MYVLRPPAVLRRHTISCDAEMPRLTVQLTSPIHDVAARVANGDVNGAPLLPHGVRFVG